MAAVLAAGAFTWVRADDDASTPVGAVDRLSRPGLSLPRPGAADAAAVTEALGDEVIFAEGGRSSLDAELVRCLVPEHAAPLSEAGPVTRGSVVIGTYALEPAFGEAMTARHLAQACLDQATQGTDLGLDDAELCRPGGDAFPRPSVILDGPACAELGAGVRPLDVDGLVRLNEARAAEVGILAVPADDGCPTLEAARSWAEDHLDGLLAGATIDVTDEGAGCYRPSVAWDHDTVTVAAVGRQPG
ncbi:MAG TPA: hypothetical protein VEW93_02415 [Acidimicrobiales bacterium]|nr:hypothetical protein [Acidimicrobiales bacterium]